MSNYVLENKDRLISSEVERYYKCAKRIVAENRDFLDAVINALAAYVCAPDIRVRAERTVCA